MEILIPIGGVWIIAIGFMIWSKYMERLEKKENKRSTK